MVFCSFTFLLFFLPIVLAGCRFLPQKAKRPFLLACSLVFYGWGSPRWLLLLLYIMALDYFGALGMEKCSRGRKPLLLALVVLNLAPLAYFKYAVFFRDTLASLTGLSIDISQPVLPAGISFFTFQGLSYLIDIYRKRAKVQHSFVLFGVYLSLFPQLVAGPIVRYTDLESQLRAPARITETDMRQGLRRFFIGLGKKLLLADAMGRFWGRMSASLTGAGLVGGWLGLIAFSFQIFFDFSGYSDMALGLGRALGFTLPENFDRPYCSLSLTEFWRRWHITLTVWFREYVYIPLGGSRKGRFRRDANLMIVWMLTGLWHGAGWNFVLWGAYFGVLLILEKRFLLERAAWKRLPAALRQTAAYLAVLLGWGLFAGKMDVFPAMAGVWGPGSAQTMLDCLSCLPLLLFCGAVSFLPRWDLPGKRLAVPLLLVLCLAALAAQGYAPFVYFQF